MEGRRNRCAVSRTDSLDIPPAATACDPLAGASTPPDQVDQLRRRRTKAQRLPKRLVYLPVVDQTPEPLDLPRSFLAHALAPLKNVFNGAVELATALVQPAPQRSGWNVEKARRALGVVALEVDERHGFTQSIRQFVHGALNHRPHLQPFQCVVGSRCRVGEVVGHGVDRRTTDWQFQAGSAHDDRPQPGSEPVRIAQRLQPGQRLPERLGGRVLGGGKLARHAKRRGSGGTPVAREERPYRGPIAPSRQLHQLPIRGLTHVIE